MLGISKEERKRKENNIFEIFFLFVVLGLSTQFSRFIVGGLWVCCVHERILMGFGDLIDFPFACLAFRRSNQTENECL